MVWLIHPLLNAMINRPLSNLLIILAHARRAVVRPWVAIIEREPEREHISISLAHDELPQRIDAVVEMTMQVRRLGRRVAAQGLIMPFIIRLPQEIQAVQLVEDFDSNAEAALPCCGVRDLECAFRVHVHLDHLFARNHGVGD